MANVKKQDIRDDRNEPAPQELPERELDNVAGGGRKAGGDQQNYLVVKLKEVLITG